MSTSPDGPLGQCSAYLLRLIGLSLGLSASLPTSHLACLLAHRPLARSDALFEEDETSTKRCRWMVKKKSETELVKPKEQQSDGNCTQNQGKSNNSKSPELERITSMSGQEEAKQQTVIALLRWYEEATISIFSVNRHIVTGKAVMLDEIINYVQSFQHQVEFLLLKLATVNPQLDFNNMASFIPKDVICGTMPNLVCSMETSEVSVAYISQPQHGNSIHYVFPNGMVTQSAIDMLDTTFHQNLSTHHHPLIVSGSSQVGAFWEDDLQNVTSCGHMAQLVDEDERLGSSVVLPL
ncbi:hypothetical protein ZIOFF_075448 [Zingiber officinale]|uniref:Uncharacterized protein n=1 Tax=Zingiber officinale TaxID=94328 RepID=A0A8J5BT90_ZINOF|nr:hypothetical protein ZIOFF_075448 [Zingiber officinale]